MTSIPRVFAVFGVALIAAGAAHAVESVELTAGDSGRFQRRHQAPAQEEARNADSGMQAVCREILVDTDEGYGVTSRESRVICDALR